MWISPGQICLRLNAPTSANIHLYNIVMSFLVVFILGSIKKRNIKVSLQTHILKNKTHTYEYISIFWHCLDTYLPHLMPVTWNEHSPINVNKVENKYLRRRERNDDFFQSYQQSVNNAKINPVLSSEWCWCVVFFKMYYKSIIQKGAEGSFPRSIFNSIQVSDWLRGPIFQTGYPPCVVVMGTGSIPL